jgi:hypothetical protein
MADMTTDGAGTRRSRSARGRGGGQRLATETRRAFTTTEFWVYLAASAAILIAGLVTSAGDGADDRLPAKETWLYFAIVTAAYLISRGLAKAGSREPYWAGGSNEQRPYESRGYEEQQREERYTRG